MYNAFFSQNQFQIVVGMSEAEIISVRYHDRTLFIEVSGINILYDFKKLDLFNPDISYEEWLNIKYKSVKSDMFEHITIDQPVIFEISEPMVYYEGEQDIFIELLSKFDFEEIEDPIHRYIFGGSYRESSYDEFEVLSNYPIELKGFQDLKQIASNYIAKQEAIYELSTNLEIMKEDNQKKDKLKKRKKIENNLFVHL